MSGRFPGIELVRESQAPSGCGTSYQALFDYQGDDTNRQGRLGIVLGNGIVITALMSATGTLPPGAEELLDELFTNMRCTLQTGPSS